MEIENKRKTSRGWKVATVIFAIAFIGASAARIIPALAGINPTADNPTSAIGPLLWGALLGVGLCKIGGKNGWLGLLTGLISGFAILVLSSIILTQNQ